MIVFSWIWRLKKWLLDPAARQLLMDLCVNVKLGTVHSTEVQADVRTGVILRVSAPALMVRLNILIFKI